MRASENQSGVYDAEKPWISGPHEDPSQANWLAEFLVPVGRTAKPVFLRGQSVLALLRLAVTGAGLGLLSSSPWLGSAILFFGFLLVLFMSTVSHVRRLTDSGRSPMWVAFLFIPIFTVSAMTIPELTKIPEKVEASQEEARKAREKLLADTSDTAEPPPESATDTPKEAPSETRRQGPATKPLTTEGLLSGAVSFAAMLCVFLSFFTALFSLLFVARGQTVPDEAGPTFAR